MKRTHGTLLTYLGILFGVAALLASSQTSPIQATHQGTTLGQPATQADLNDLIGSWSGTWNDTIYSVGGSLAFEITEAGGIYSATGDIGLQSLGLGLEGGTASGAVVTNDLQFSFVADMVGGGNGTVDPNTGAASGSGVVTAPLNFGAFVFQGSAVGDVISGIFDFTSPTGGAGVASLMRVTTAVRDMSWAEIKSQYRESTDAP